MSRGVPSEDTKGHHRAAADTARIDAGKGGQVIIYVQGKAMHTHPVPHPDPDRGSFP